MNPPAMTPPLVTLLRQLGLDRQTPPSRSQWEALFDWLSSGVGAPVQEEMPKQYWPYLTHHLGTPTLVVDPADQVSYWNAACQELYGLSPEEVVGSPLPRLLSSPLEGLRVTGLIKRVRAGERLESVTVAFANPLGGLRLTACTFWPLPGGQAGEVFVALSLKPVSDRVLPSTAQRHDRQHFYESLLGALPAPLVIFDSQHRYVFCNELAIRDPEVREWIIGRTDEEYVAFRRLDPRMAQVRRQHFLQAIEERRTVYFEEQLRGSEGQPVYFLRTYTPVFNAAGDLELCLGHGMDITELRQTQEALRLLNGELEDRVLQRTADLERATQRLKHDTLHDALTGLPNRLLFSDRLKQAIDRAGTGGHNYAVLFLDTDRFKGVNDTLGHPAGDALLLELGKRLRSCVRDTDTVARLGGDEFTVLLEPLMSAEQAPRVAERIQEELRRPMILEGQHVSLSASIGIVLGEPEYREAADVLRDADIAMYRAKDSGRAQWQVFTPQMREHTLHVNRLESELRLALERGELRLLYQPVLDLRRGETVGFEALVRWQHPERGLLGPGEFSQVAEDTGLMTEIDRWVLREACRQMRRWQLDYPRDPPMSLSVNFSGKHVRGGRLPDFVAGVLAETDFDPRLLHLELTESTLLEQSEVIAGELSRIRDLQVGLHLDDFGTGYSSLSYLQLYPLDAIKIDRSFVCGMLENSGSAELVRTIVAMAKNMNLRVIAEGIEQPGHLQALLGLGCHYGQGYLFSPPLDVEGARAFVIEGQTRLRASWGLPERGA